MENLEVKKGYFILFWHDLYGGLNWYGPYKSKTLAKKEAKKRIPELIYTRYSKQGYYSSISGRISLNQTVKLCTIEKLIL